MNCWGGGAAQTASRGMDDSGRVTKVNHFYNGSGMGMSFAIATCGAGFSGSLGSVALKLMTPGR